MLTVIVNPSAALTADGLTAWAAATGEPAFLTERRLQALAQYLATPMPGRRDETWRRVDLAGLNIEAAAARAPAEGLVELSTPSAEARARGVFWGTPAEAGKAVPDVLQRHWATEVFPAGAVTEVGDGRKFRALNQALWDSGYVCHVPQGVEVELPVQAEFRTRSGEDGIFPHNLVVLDEGAAATVIESYVSHAAGKGLCCPQTEIILGAGARLRYILLQATGPEIIHIGAHRTHQYADSRLTFVSAHLGSRLEKSFIATRLLAPRARANLAGLYCGTGAQRVHLDTLQHHVAPECASDLLYKGVLGGRARGVYRGMIHLEPGAQKTDAYQQNRTLLLSDQARVDSIPGLEILANDVRCSHGATAGQIDPEILFYLMSRGLPRLDAKRMIIDGFLDEVIRRFALEAVIAPLREQVDLKLGQEIVAPGNVGENRGA